MKIKSALLLSIAVLLAAGPSLRAAEDFHCEVLSVDGKATLTDAEGKERELKEGDLVSKNETLKTDSGSYIDLSFDKNWKNVTRIESSSKLKVTSVQPAKLNLISGAVFAKLRALPKDSAFEVRTPTATATVRGTEYRTLFKGGETQVFNVSPTGSKVSVFGVNNDGTVNTAREIVLAPSTKTAAKTGEAPQAPSVMTMDEVSVTKSLQSGIDEKVKEAEKEGRAAKIPSVEEIEKVHAAAVTDEYSRVNDTRRRAFKGGTSE